MQVITLAQVKTQLGIGDTTYDTAITALLPTIDAKVKLITKNNYSFRFVADTTVDDTSATAYALYDTTDRNGSGINNPYVSKSVYNSLEVGQELEGDDIATGAYITDL